MSPPWAQLAVLVLGVWAVSLAQANLTTLGTNWTFIDGHDIQHAGAWSDPIPGTKPLRALWQRPVDIAKRECMSNGSNYCFGNTVDSCPRCGTCCVGDSKHCCDGGKVCCGEGCCPAGQTCSDGKCVAAVTPVTLTSTISQTVTHTATQRVTIVVAEIETSTVVSTVHVTISTAATQTDVIWTTVTAIQRRAVALPHLTRLNELPDAHETTISAASQASEVAPGAVAEKPLSHIPRGATPILRREEATTITSYITTTVDITSTTSISVTTHSTSTDLTTLYHTVTRVLQADTTTTITSTLTVTSRPPSLVTITTAASPVPAATSTSAFPSIPSSTGEPNPSRQIPTSTIAGIAAGGSVLALLLAGFLILSVRRRRRRRHGPDHNDNPSSFDARHPTRAMGPRQPTLPRILPHFAPPSPPHHAAQFHPPAMYGGSAGKSGDGSHGGPRPRGESDASSQSQYGVYPYLHHPPHDYPGQYQQQPPPPHLHPSRGHHQRNSSGFTTLVGTPSPTTAVFGFKHGLASSPGVGPDGGCGEAVEGREEYPYQDHHDYPPYHYHDNQQQHAAQRPEQGQYHQDADKEAVGHEPWHTRDYVVDTHDNHNNDNPYPPQHPSPSQSSTHRPRSPLSASARERVWWAELDGSSPSPPPLARSPPLHSGSRAPSRSGSGPEREQERRAGASPPPAELAGD